ncbi:hypothetical protein [Psychrobacillus sp. L3]|uniref:hypothetical protein n=1 Tax=Psychrobacillus sp. L3 TaxID=3236891 RepID=UPI0036F290CE
MKKTFTRKLKPIISYFFVMIILCCLSYILVYQASFLPNGYEIVSTQKEEITIKSFSFIGKKKMSKPYHLEEITYGKLKKSNMKLKDKMIFCG